MYRQHAVTLQGTAPLLCSHAAVPCMPSASPDSTHASNPSLSAAHRCSAAPAATALGAAPAAAPHGCATAHGVPEEVVTAAADGEVAILAALHGAAGAGWLLLQGQVAAGEGQIASCGAVVAMWDGTSMGVAWWGCAAVAKV